MIDTRKFAVSGATASEGGTRLRPSPSQHQEARIRSGSLVRPSAEPEPLLSQLLAKHGTKAGLLVIAAFAFSYLQIALVSWYITPAKQRINDGQQPTFFAFHIEPYGVTSEDFHLYAVRAKRILERGWTDSPLTKKLESGQNFAAPLQALLGMIAVQTDGRPLPYSILMSCVFLFGWGTLFLAARRFLPVSVPTSTIVLAVMVAMLFEAVQYFFMTPAFSESLPWPIHRNMRMATLSWTTPLMLSAIIAVASLRFQPRQSKSAILWAGAVLVVLTGVDNWAFGLAWMAAALMFARLAIAQVHDCLLTRVVLPRSLQSLFWLAMILVGSYGLNCILNRGVIDDVAMRSGLSADWLHPHQDGNVLWHIVHVWLIPTAALTVGLTVLLPLLDSFTVKSVGPATWLVRVNTGPISRWNIPLIAVISTVAMICMTLILARRGMEPYLRFQLYWRVDPILLFCLMVALAESLRGWLSRLSVRWPRLAYAWSPIAMMAIAALFAYHQYRIHWFVKNTIGHEYFLTADEEKLRPWVENFDRINPSGYTLATLSPELNYLSGYWTNADLSLPSGFPYHNLSTNEHIHRAIVDVLRLYNVSPETWVTFTDPKPIHFDDRWRVSRVEAAGLSLMYHLYHRAFTLDSDSKPKWEMNEIQAIAQDLADPSDQKSLQPDIILIDDVSRALGEPDLTDYTLVFESGSIEVWRRQTTKSAGHELPGNSALTSN
jgi:hypothetical protein